MKSQQCRRPAGLAVGRRSAIAAAPRPQIPPPPPPEGLPPEIPPTRRCSRCAGLGWTVSAVPPDLAPLVLAGLHIKELVACRRVSRAFRRLADQSLLPLHYQQQLCGLGSSGGEARARHVLEVALEAAARVDEADMRAIQRQQRRSAPPPPPLPPHDGGHAHPCPATRGHQVGGGRSLLQAVAGLVAATGGGAEWWDDPSLLRRVREFDVAQLHGLGEREVAAARHALLAGSDGQTFLEQQRRAAAHSGENLRRALGSVAWLREWLVAVLEAHRLMQVTARAALVVGRHALLQGAASVASF
jgi:hypothetical protein